MAQTQAVTPQTINRANREEGVRLEALHPAIRTHAVGPTAIERTEQPRLESRIEGGRISPPSARAILVERAAEDAGVGAARGFPNVALGVILVALAREGHGSDKLKELAAIVREQLKDIDLLLSLSGELNALPDKSSYDISKKMNGLIGQLEARKIQVWEGGKKISKEQLGELKAQIGSQIDKLRTAVQTTISTEIQPETNNLQTIMNIVQQIIQADARLKKKTTEVPR